ncbi:MAG TPA: ABC transporter ATP-binding protein [Chloroflexota bacterium]|nr:ABC transporter ATP-binding protein [Chloroflexota bacterium]
MAVRTLRVLQPFLAGQTRPLILVGAVALGLTMIQVLTALSIGWVVDSLIGEHAGQAGPAFLGMFELTRGHVLALLLTSALLRGALLARRQALAGRIGEGVVAQIRNTLWAHLQRLPLEETRRRGTGRLLLRFTSDTRSIQRFVTYGLAQVSQDLLVGGAVLLALVLLNWRMGLAVALVVPAYALIFWRTNPVLQEKSRLARRRRSDISAFLDERIDGMATVKAFVQHRHETARLKRMTHSLARWGSELAAASGRMQGLTTSTVAVSTTLVLALAAGEVAAGRLSVGSLVTCITLVGLLSPIFRRLANANRYVQEASISVERLAHLLAARPEYEPAGPAQRLRLRTGRVTIDKISFAYGDGRPSLRDVSVRARRGELVAIVGASGAGRSTLLNLLPRFLSPTAGTITIDGQDVTDISPAVLRSRIGFVHPEAPIFEATIADNVGYGVRQGRTDRQARIEHAARLVGLDRLVARLPNGWETMLGDRGRPLSRGEQQRIALARVLAADPPILLLDEATAGLDAASERALAVVLRGLAQEKTVIAATRSVPILELADRIYVLKGGRVVEKGTHAALLRGGGPYSRLVGGPRDAPQGDALLDGARPGNDPGRVKGHSMQTGASV